MIGYRDEVVGWLMCQPSDTRFECRLKKRKRSTTQNAYYWVMLNELARVIGVSDTEVHERMLREYGVTESTWIREDVPAHELYDHYDETGRMVTMAGGNYREVMAYKGSSKMDSGEFSRLIDGMRWECEQLGIDVMTPEEVAALRFVEPEWRGNGREAD